jgi:asparagine N-glycosylation enzyme membrane subunit Stt3
MATWPPAKRLQFVVAEQWFFFRFGAAVGGYVGSVLAPTVGWIFLRRAPLQRAIEETALGTLIGIAVAAAIQPRFVVFYALGGFLAGATRLWLAERGRQARAS